MDRTCDPCRVNVAWKLSSDGTSNLAPLARKTCGTRAKAEVHCGKREAAASAHWPTFLTGKPSPTRLDKVLESVKAIRALCARGTSARSGPMRRMRVAGGACAVTIGVIGLFGVSFAESINGKIVFAGPLPPQKKLEVTIDQYLCGNEKDAGDLLLSPQKELKNAVVWIDNPPPGAVASTPPPKVEMDQNGCVFSPRVVVVPAGGTVDFLNSDRLLHNIHATPKLNVSFNRTQPKGRNIAVTFEKPEIVRITCDLH